MAPIVIGAQTNLQDGTIVHVDEGVPCTVGRRVGVGHRVILHGCTVEDECLIGMGSILLNGVRIGTGSVVAAGAVIPEGMQVPPGSLVMGVPGPDRADRGRDPDAADRGHLGALRGAGAGASGGAVSGAGCGGRAPRRHRAIGQPGPTRSSLDCFAPLRALCCRVLHIHTHILST